MKLLDGAEGEALDELVLGREPGGAVSVIEVIEGLLTEQRRHGPQREGGDDDGADNHDDTGGEARP